MTTSLFTQPKLLRMGIFLIWLFHLSGAIGITWGYKDWFIEKTWLNLMACVLIFAFCYPMNTSRKWLIFGLFFGIGMFVEWLGANFSLLFGSYDYGNNLGPKIDGVPLFIGINWALLTFITAALVTKPGPYGSLRALGGAALMVFLDFFMEKSAPIFDFWSFGPHVPLENYITWFVIAFVLHLILFRSRLKGNRIICLHLYLAQLAFFAYFTFFPA
ncbi:MAG: carotenoid biosynthesis protein [Bacteroidota bacterium]